MLRSRVTDRRHNDGVERRVAPMQPAADPATLPVTFIVHLLVTFLVPLLLRRASERVAS